MGKLKQYKDFLMGKLTKDNEDGRWVTIKGTHVFIKKGQSVKEAMDKKFSSDEKFKAGKKEKYEKKWKEYERKEGQKKSLKDKEEGRRDKYRAEKEKLRDQLNKLEAKNKGEETDEESDITDKLETLRQKERKRRIARKESDKHEIWKYSKDKKKDMEGKLTNDCSGQWITVHGGDDDEETAGTHVCVEKGQSKKEAIDKKFKDKSEKSEKPEKKETKKPEKKEVSKEVKKDPKKPPKKPDKDPKKPDKPEEKASLEKMLGMPEGVLKHFEPHTIDKFAKRLKEEGKGELPKTKSELENEKKQKKEIITLSKELEKLKKEKAKESKKPDTPKKTPKGDPKKVPKKEPKLPSKKPDKAPKKEVAKKEVAKKETTKKEPKKVEKKEPKATEKKGSKKEEKTTEKKKPKEKSKDKPKYNSFLEMLKRRIIAEIAKVARGDDKDDFEDITDFITSDFQRINDSALGGYVVRSGGMEYKDQQGNKIIKYKDGKNLKKAYLPLKSVPAYGGVVNSHTEGSDRFIGYWDSFKHIPKGIPGVYAKSDVVPHDPKYDKKMDIDRKHDRIWSKLNLDDKKIEHLNIKKEDLKNLPVSSSYQDLGYGEKQKVGEVYHIAVSFGDEKDRCSTLNGTSCNVSLMHDFLHDQNITGVKVQDFDDTNNLNKKKEKNMTKKEKKDKEYEDEDEDDKDDKKDKEEDAVKSSETRDPMTGGEKKYPGGKVDGDDDRVEEKIKGSPYQETEKIVKKADIDDLKSEITELKDFIMSMKPVLDSVSKNNEEVMAKKASDLREDLMKEPFGYSEEYLKDKSFGKLQDLQEDFKQTKTYKDFVADTSENDFGRVDKNIIGDKSYTTKSALQDFITGSNKKHWDWAENPKDFFTDPHGGN